MNNQPKGLGFLKQRLHSAPGRKQRHRLTRATAKGQETGRLLDLFEAAATIVREATAGPMTFEKARREAIILGNELLARGYSKEALGAES